MNQKEHKCAFTIVAKNYIGLAKTLEVSFKEHNPECDFWIIVSDEVPNSILQEYDNIIQAHGILSIPENTWIECSFKYNVTEFATYIKPKSIEYLFDKGYQKVIYLDPDIYCFSSLDPVFDLLDKYKMIVSPHILTMEEETYSGDLTENIYLGMGIFNFGFFAVSDHTKTRKLLRWWDRVLMEAAFMDSYRYTATDQKWMNYLPMFFQSEDLYVSHHKGIDAATWNFYEREFIIQGDSIYVKNRIKDDEIAEPLIFVHFSGYNYSELSSGTVKHKALSHEYEDLKIIFDKYIQGLNKSNIDKYLKFTYSYNAYTDGCPITSINRRIYRRLLMEGRHMDNPFDSDGNFYNQMKKSRLLTKNKASFATKVANTNSRANSRYEKIIDELLRRLLNVIGIDKYDSLRRYLINRLQPENQIFLYDKESYKNL